MTKKDYTPSFADQVHAFLATLPITPGHHNYREWVELLRLAQEIMLQEALRGEED